MKKIFRTFIIFIVFLIIPFSIYSQNTNPVAGFVSVLGRNDCKIFTSDVFKKSIRWSGECVDGFADGKGVAKHYIQDVLKVTVEGNFIKGILNGETSLIAVEGYQFKGEYKDGKPNGTGTAIYSNGNKYVGEYKDGKVSGQGKLTFKDGTEYVGEFKNDQANGQGVLTSPDGSKHVGEFKNDSANGQGVLTALDGSKYVGGFKDGKRNGKGTLTQKDGTEYIGEFKNDSANGQGILTSPNGKYVGNFKDGLFHGNGSFISSSFSYEGEFKNNKMNGQGVMTGKDGSKYSGEFKDDEITGKGTVTSAEGSKYVGEFKSGKYHGMGTLTLSNGSVQDGNWNEGKFIKDDSKERELRERCLSNGAVGVCQVIKVGITTNVCGNASLKFQSLDCFVTDYDVIKFNLEIRNNLKRSISDIQIQCNQLAKSGTVLKIGQHTEYDIWQPQQTKSISIKFNKHPQTASAICAAMNWSNK